MAYTRRVYAGGAAATTVTGAVASNATSITIASYTGWPYHATDPFYVVLSPGTASEEKLLVTRTTATSTTLSVTTRGVDGTTAASHSSGAAIYPVFTAVDADEANVVASTLTTKGDLLTYTGSAYARTGVGANNTLLVADSAQTNGIKWSDDLTLGSLVVSENASTDAVRITQVGSGNALLVEDSANPDSTPFVINSAGAVGIGTTSLTGETLRVAKNITGATSSYAVHASGEIQSDVTTAVRVFRSSPTTANSNFTLAQISHFSIVEGTYNNITAGGAVTNQYGFVVGSGLTQATNNYAFYGGVASGTGRWNFYAAGTARNYFAGGLEVISGTTSMTSGFTHVPSAAGTPTGTPTNPTGNVPLYYDTTNNKLYVYNGAWKSVALA